MPVRDGEWDHINTWQFTYRMKAAAADFSQIVISHDWKFYRCVKADFIDLCYSCTNERWTPVGDCFFGNQAVIETSETPDGHTIFKTLLYVVEEYSDLRYSLEQSLENSEALMLEGVFDEIFGDG
jgi:hypothetical protein